MKKLIIPIFIVVQLMTSGCVVFQKEAEVMRRDTKLLDQRVSKIESDMEQEQQHLTEMIERARTDVEKLEETLTRATRVLARNSADFGAEMETIKDKLRVVDGTLAEMQNQVSELGKSTEKAMKKAEDFALAAGLDMPVDESKIPAKANAHFESIKDAFAEGRFGEVRSLSKVFLQRYPKDKHADDVQLRIAKSYIEQKRWAKSLGALRRFTDKYPKSELTAEVLYEMSHSFFALGDCTDARILIDAIESRHSKSPFVTKAKKLTDTMEKQKSRCTS